MKKLYRASFIILIPLIGGLLLTLLGGEKLYPIGIMLMSIGTPVVMVVFVVVGLVLMITGRLGDDKATRHDEQSGENVERGDESDSAAEQCNEEGETSQNEQSEREKEMQKLNDINSSYRYENRMKEAEYMSRHVAQNYKNAPLKDKVLGWLFFGFLIGDFVLIMVFVFLEIMIGAFICMGIFGGTILIALIVKVILEKTSMHYKVTDPQSLIEAKVKACLLSSTTSVGSRHTTRITRVIYRVIVTADDNEYTAYSDIFYNVGETVTIAVIGKHRASIVRGNE